MSSADINEHFEPHTTKKIVRLFEPFHGKRTLISIVDVIRCSFTHIHVCQPIINVNGLQVTKFKIILFSLTCCFSLWQAVQILMRA